MYRNRGQGIFLFIVCRMFFNLFPSLNFLKGDFNPGHGTTEGVPWHPIFCLFVIMWFVSLQVEALFELVKGLIKDLEGTLQDEVICNSFLVIYILHDAAKCSYLWPYCWLFSFFILKWPVLFWPVKKRWPYFLSADKKK